MSVAAIPAPRRIDVPPARAGISLAASVQPLMARHRPDLLGFALDLWRRLPGAKATEFIDRAPAAAHDLTVPGVTDDYDWLGVLYGSRTHLGRSTGARLVGMRLMLFGLSAATLTALETDLMAIPGDPKASPPMLQAIVAAARAGMTAEEIKVCLRRGRWPDLDEMVAVAALRGARPLEPMTDPQWDYWLDPDQVSW